MERRILNRAIFERIEIGEDGEPTLVALTPTYAALSAWEPGFGKPKGVWARNQGRRGRSAFVRPTSVSADNKPGRFGARRGRGTKAGTKRALREYGGCRAECRNR
jgi:hypothetical protein